MTVKNLLKNILPVLMLLLFTSCKTNRIKNNERHGKWIDTFSTPTVTYKTVGRFKNGFEKGTHKRFANKKLHRKEKYKNGICHTIYYYPNGTVMSQGDTKLSVTDEELHWYYQGDWKFYDENGKLLGIKSYEQGQLVNQVETESEALSN